MILYDSRDCVIKRVTLLIFFFFLFFFFCPALLQSLVIVSGSMAYQVDTTEEEMVDYSGMYYIDYLEVCCLWFNKKMFLGFDYGLGGGGTTIGNIWMKLFHDWKN